MTEQNNREKWLAKVMSHKVWFRRGLKQSITCKIFLRLIAPLKQQSIFLEFEKLSNSWTLHLKMSTDGHFSKLVIKTFFLRVIVPGKRFYVMFLNGIISEQEFEETE